MIDFLLTKEQERSMYRVWWWARGNNFGELLSPYLVSKITKSKIPTEPVHATRSCPSIYSA